MESVYLPRHLRRNLQVHLRQFPVVLLLGARQVGKTTSSKPRRPGGSGLMPTSVWCCSGAWGNSTIPLEVKRATRIGAYDLRGLTSFLEAFCDRAPFGVVLYNGGDAVRASERIVLVPIARTL
jgi:hypothetical protein